MTLAIIVILLVGGFLLPIRQSDPGLRGRIGLSLVFGFTAVGHFIKTDAMVEMLPPWLPAREAIVLATGVLEFLFIPALLFPRTSRPAGWLVIAFLIAVFPANVRAAMLGLELGGGEMGPLYLLIRAPVQLLLIVWAYLFAIRVWHPRPDLNRSQSR